jgi:ribonuclease PH
MRPDGRLPDQLRPVTFALDYVIYPEGSVLISLGNTRVLCNVTLEEGVPRWMSLQNKPGGWITAEYSMLPRATHQRKPREIQGLGGRTQEIRRLIGRSLRAAIDLEKIGSRTITVDCDVLQADGGTRTASITGGYVALALALGRLIGSGEIPPQAILGAVAAVSAGISGGVPVLDLAYAEDASADADFNVVMNAAGDFIEVQGTAEGATFSRAALDHLLDLAAGGIQTLLEAQRAALKDTGLLWA